MLLDKPDSIDAIKESDISDDDHHNVEDIATTDEYDDDDDTTQSDSQQVETNSYTNSNGEYVEETKDPSGRFYTKKVVKQGNGFSSVTIVSQGEGVQLNIGGGGGSLFE